MSRAAFCASFLLSLDVVAAATCSGARNLALCARFVTPFSTNNFTWQSFNTGICPDGMTATCCTPCLTCGNVGVDCDGPITTAPPINDGSLPPGWSTAVPCAVDNADRVLANIRVTYQPTNTPSACAQQCASQGFTFAGVEFSDECYCGTGFMNGVAPPSANKSDCSMPCAGDTNSTCGGPWRIQLYSSN